MSGKYTIFDDKKINESNFYKNKKLIQIDNVDVNKILTSKENHMVKKNHLSTLLDILTIMILNH